MAGELLVKEKKDKTFLLELELSVGYPLQILISYVYTMAGNSNYGIQFRQYMLEAS